MLKCMCWCAVPVFRKHWNALLNSKLNQKWKHQNKYCGSFSCLWLASFWDKALSSIEERNKILQAWGISLDAESALFADIMEELKQLQDQWPKIVLEACLVVIGMGILLQLSQKRGRKWEKISWWDTWGSMFCHLWRWNSIFIQKECILCNFGQCYLRVGVPIHSNKWHLFYIPFSSKQSYLEIYNKKL